MGCLNQGFDRERPSSVPEGCLGEEAGPAGRKHKKWVQSMQPHSTRCYTWMTISINKDLLPTETKCLRCEIYRYSGIWPEYLAWVLSKVAPVVWVWYGSCLIVWSTWNSTLQPWSHITICTTIQRISKRWEITDQILAGETVSMFHLRAVHFFWGTTLSQEQFPGVSKLWPHLACFLYGLWI